MSPGDAAMPSWSLSPFRKDKDIHLAIGLHIENYLMVDTKASRRFTRGRNLCTNESGVLIDPENEWTGISHRRRATFDVEL
jgi:hypothetical protein